MWKRRYTDVHKKTKSCKLCIFNPYSFRVIYPWNLPSLFETFLILMSIARGFSDHLPDWYPINKYLIKGEFLLRGTKLWNFIFHKELFQLSGEKRCLFRNCMLSKYDSWSSWRHESLLCFGIGGPRFFVRVALAIISKYFTKLVIIMYYRIENMK